MCMVAGVEEDLQSFGWVLKTVKDWYIEGVY